jgi:hypothetical protein
MSDEGIEGQLAELRRDYQQEEGQPFRHFYCPILHRDEQTELCEGHVVNQKLPASSRLWVVQRKDVDGFYGRIFETDVVAMIQSRERTFTDALFDKDLRRKLNPQITADGEEVPIYYPGRRDRVPPYYSPLTVEGDRGTIHMGVRLTPDEMAELSLRNLQIEMKLDCRTAGVVSMIKAAHLTMFRLLRYGYALSGAGIDVGRFTLGQFYLENQGRRDREVRAAAPDFFRRYVNAVRPVQYAGQTPPRGTVEDRRLGVCFGSSGRPFAFIVFVRTADWLHAVLLPEVRHPDSAAAYWHFLRSDRTTIQASSALFDADKQVFRVVEEPEELAWGKEDPATALG